MVILGFILDFMNVNGSSHRYLIFSITIVNGRSCSITIVNRISHYWICSITIVIGS